MSELIKTLSLWAEFNTTVKKGYTVCGLYSPIEPSSTPCNYSEWCEECFFGVVQETQNKTIESLDRHTGWKL